MRIRITNKESHIIEIQGFSSNVYLKPNESYEFTTPKYEINDIEICGFDTHSGSIRVAVNILSGKPEGATIRIGGRASDGS